MESAAGSMIDHVRDSQASSKVSGLRRSIIVEDKKGVHMKVEAEGSDFFMDDKESISIS